MVDDLDAVAARLRGAGAEVDERERETFEGYLRFHAFDPHGNRVEVLQPRPGAYVTAASRRRTRRRTAPRG